MARTFDLTKIYDAGTFTNAPAIVEDNIKRRKDFNFVRGLSIVQTDKDPEALGVLRTKEGTDADDKFLINIQYKTPQLVKTCISDLRNIHREAEFAKTYYTRINMQQVNFGYTMKNKRAYAIFYVECSLAGRTI